MFYFKSLNDNGYICSTENKNQLYPYVIQLTPKQTLAVSRTMPPMTDAEMIFAYASLYILFPLLYIIISTGNITPLMTIWHFLTSGIFRTFEKIQDYLSDVVYAILRATGQYSFSTYTVVQNGREIYTASSLCYNYPSDRITVYKIDRAKYNVCKWIDAQCELYRRQYNGDEPEVSESRNDIYDFILHKVDGQPYTRIHRGNFTGQTHTLGYRPFCKSYQFVDSAVLTVTMPTTSTTADATNTDDAKTETFLILLKYPNHFFLEKNEILDKKFLQWKMYNEHKRKDIANYIGLPFSNYSVTMYYNDSMKNYFTTTTTTTETTDAPTPSRYTALTIDNTNFVLIGKQYVVKVDSVLRCPIFDSNDKHVFDIDGVLTQYYSESDNEDNSNNKRDNDSDSDDNDDNNDDYDNDNDNDNNDDNDNDNDNDGDNDNNALETEVDPEFEILEEVNEAR